jgi:hypothetical protein
MGSWLTALVWVGLAVATPSDRVMVPVELQVELLSKLMRYDRNFTARAGGQVHVLVVYERDTPESVHVGRQYLAALNGQAQVGGLPHQEELVAFTDATSLAVLARERRATLIVFAPGLANKADALAAAFVGFDTLTVSSTPEGVRGGLVLGFDLVSGKPRMLFNLGQARRQRADFRAEILQLMTVFQ